MHGVSWWGDLQGRLRQFMRRDRYSTGTDLRIISYTVFLERGALFAALQCRARCLQKSFDEP
jgi:hypothetical protein